jgi:uncharacterized protein YfaS (alpha-2-macroglobulin family)
MYGIGLSVQPQAKAALIYSLPYLANYPYGCAEQTFNKLLAYITACKLIRTDTVVQQSFEQAKKNLEKENTDKEKLPDELADETMPWLGLNSHTEKLQEQLFNLLDTSRSKPLIDELLKKLYKMQNADGGITWFPGGKSDFYISNYLLRGFGKLKKDDMLVSSLMNDNKHEEFINRLIDYADSKFPVLIKNYEWRNMLNYAYARSYWISLYPIDESIKQQLRKYLLEQLKKADANSLSRQALLIITSLRLATDNAEELYIQPATQLKSIKQRAIEDEQNGLRWKELADNDDLTNSSEETIALLAEAFVEIKDSLSVSKISKWLLTAKNEHSWKNTKATAAAINILQKENNTASNDKQSVKLSAGDKTVSAGSDLLSGSGFDFIKSSAAGNISLQKEKPVAASGNVYRYYFTSSVQPEFLNKEVQLQKEFFKWNDKESKWETLKPGDVLKIADKVKVVVTVNTSKVLQYVFIDDKRAALFEPAINNSGYEYAEGFSYYQSVRDAGYQFFMDNIPSGKHEISYELKVAQEGSFFSGSAVLQCMYKPEVTAYSNTEKFNSAK